MRMDYILLENFALIKTGMGLYKIELDFRGYKNLINFIVGNNGTGKTALMSNFHPYATLGNLEAREDTDLIIPNKDGRKVVDFRDKKNKYHIVHHYKWQGEKRSRKISSYIEKNGKELNETGNVTSFNTIIESEFGIDVNFLKLIRLGPNVHNFIQLSSTERKGFISKLLAEVEVYARDYKYSQERSKLLKSALKIAINKKDKLNVSDVKILEADIRQKEKLLKTLRSNKEDTIKSFYKYKGSVNVDEFENCETVLMTLTDKIREIGRMIDKLKLPKYSHVTLGKKDKISEYSTQLKALNDEKMKYVSKRAKIATKLDSYKENASSVEGKMKLLDADTEQKDMRKYIKELKDKISNYEKNFNEKEVPDITKDELCSDIDKINMIFFHLDQIYDLPDNALKYFKETVDCNGIDLNKMNTKAVEEINELNRKIRSLESSSEIKHGKLKVLFVPSTCKLYKKCPYYTLVHNDSNDGNNRGKLAEYKDRLESVEGLSNIISSIYSITKILSMRSGRITSYTITLANVINAIVKRDKNEIVNHDLVQKILESIEFHDEYLKNKVTLESMEGKLAVRNATKGIGTQKELNRELSDLMIKINDMSDKLRGVDSDVSQVEAEISHVENLMDDYVIYTKYKQEKTSLTTELSDVKKQLDDYRNIYFDKQEYLVNENKYKKDIESLDYTIKQTENAIYDTRVRVTQYNQLTEEISHVEERFDIVELLKEAVTSHKGIPLIYINAHCKSLKEIANSIIRDIYDGELILRDFRIDDKEFTIPYYTKGSNVRDIRYASQAEVSVATLALSFAILSQFMAKYNIVLLDEVDGPMYEDNKKRLFAALEGQLEKLGTEQAFIITQSSMYNDYPVNLIVTDPDYRKVINDSTNVIFQR